MAVDLSSQVGPTVTVKADLSATGGNAIKFTLPVWCRCFSLKVVDSSGNATTGTVSTVAPGGGDDSAAGADAFPIGTAGITIPTATLEQARGSVLTWYVSGPSVDCDAKFILQEVIF